MKTKFSISLDEKLVEKLKELAKKENRNLSNMIEVLLSSAIEDR